LVTGKDVKRTPHIPLRLGNAEIEKTPDSLGNAEINGILEIKRLTAWRTCKWANSQMRAPSSDHPQHLHP
jgi:hypothetical protein